MQQRIVKIVNRFGLHARAAARLVAECSRFQSVVTLRVGARRADGRQFIALLLLSASLGVQVAIEADGPDETRAIAAVARLIDEGFGEDPQP